MAHCAHCGSSKSKLIPLTEIQLVWVVTTSTKSNTDFSFSLFFLLVVLLAIQMPTLWHYNPSVVNPPCWQKMDSLILKYIILSNNIPVLWKTQNE